MNQLENAAGHRSGELPHGYLGRLSHRYGLRVAHFATEMGIAMTRLVDGCSASLDRLAALSGADRAELGLAAVVREPDHWTLRGQSLDRTALCRTRLRFCPCCVAADLGAANMRSRPSPVIPAVWYVAPVRTCPHHQVALLGAPALKDGKLLPLETYDLPLRLAAVAERPESFTAQAVPRAPNALEAYLLTRLAAGQGGAEWLDSLPFYVAARTCEMLGAMHELGPRHDLDIQEERGWYDVAGIGFEIAKGGIGLIRRFLRDVQRSSPACAVGRAQAIFGRFWQWLAYTAAGADFEPVFRLMHDHIVETMPVAAGEVILGIEVERRRVHSIRTASLETGLHPKRLRKLLANAELIPSDHAGSVDNFVLFDAQAAAPMLAAVRQQVSLRDAGAYLNAPRVQAKLLVAEKIIIPIVPTKSPQGSKYAFARADLDDFLGRLFARAVPIDEIGEGCDDIPGAAKRANCGAAEIIRLIFEGRLAWVGRRAGVAGYMSAVVNVAEVRLLSRGYDPGGLGLRELAKQMRCADRVLNLLIERGHLSMRIGRNPINRCPMTVVPEAELERFEAKYVSLFRLAVETKMHFRKVKMLLREAGVEAALDPLEYKCTFYLRDRVRSVFG